MGANIVATSRWLKANPRKVQANNEKDLASEDMQGHKTLDSSGQQKRCHSPNGFIGRELLVAVMTQDRNYDAHGPLGSP